MVQRSCHTAILSLAVLIAGLSLPALAGAQSVDALASGDQATAKATVTSSTFSTGAANELLLAFIATDYLTGANTTVTGVAGAGLTWELVRRTNTQPGGAEIWRAFASASLATVTVTATLSQPVISSITVVSFS